MSQTHKTPVDDLLEADTCPTLVSAGAAHPHEEVRGTIADAHIPTSNTTTEKVTRCIQ
jgi:hypothetical protein